jgi:hypothetical protein
VKAVAIILAVLFYVQAWFDVAAQNYAHALLAGLVMFTLLMGASHLDSQEDLC